MPRSLWFKKSIQKPQVCELSRLSSETSKKLYVHEFGFSCSFAATYCDQMSLFLLFLQFQKKTPGFPIIFFTSCAYLLTILPIRALLLFVLIMYVGKVIINCYTVKKLSISRPQPECHLPKEI